jgi:DNA-binding response OmpR family regulator
MEGDRFAGSAPWGAPRLEPHPVDDASISLGRCTIDLATRQVTCAGEVVDLTA